MTDQRALDNADRSIAETQRRAKAWAVSHHKLLVFFGALSIGMILGAPSCRDYNGGGPTLDGNLPMWVETIEVDE